MLVATITPPCHLKAQPACAGFPLLRSMASSRRLTKAQPIYVGIVLPPAALQEERIFPSVFCTTLSSGPGTQEALAQPPLVDPDPQQEKALRLLLQHSEAFLRVQKKNLELNRPWRSGGGQGSGTGSAGAAKSSQRKKKTMPVPQSCHGRPALARWRPAYKL